MIYQNSHVKNAPHLCNGLISTTPKLYRYIAYTGAGTSEFLDVYSCFREHVMLRMPCLVDEVRQSSSEEDLLSAAVPAPSDDEEQLPGEECF